LGEKF